MKELTLSEATILDGLNLRFEGRHTKKGTATILMGGN